MVLEIANGTFASAITKGVHNVKWLRDISSKAIEWMKNAGKNILSYLNQVKGGAIEVFNAIASGNWGLFSDWFKNAPLLPKIAGSGAALLTAGILILGGGKIIGSVGSGLGALISRIGTGVAARIGPGGVAFLGTALANAAPQIMSAVVQTSERLWHFDWSQSDKALMQGIKNAIEGLYTPLGQALGRSVASIIVGGAVKNVPKLRINVRQLANLIEIHDGNESVKNSLLSAVTNLWYAVKSAGKNILAKMSYMNVRKYAAKAVGKEDEWGKEAPSFTFAAQFEEGIKTIVPNEKVAEAVIEGFEEFFDTLGDLVTEEDVYTEFI